MIGELGEDVVLNMGPAVLHLHAGSRIEDMHPVHPVLLRRYLGRREERRQRAWRSLGPLNTGIAEENEVLRAAISCIPARAQGPSTLSVSSPLEYQVFQRSTRLHGAILVRGSALAATRVEARVEATSIEGPLPNRWQRLALDQAKQAVPL
jgi:hypothetical protein